MGYETDLKSGEAAPWSQYREQFPVTNQFVYMNHAGVAPLSKPAADAMQKITDEVLHFGSCHYDGWLATYDALRAAAARLIGAHRSEIAIVKNTSEGIATVAMGLDWKRGDKMVAFTEEFAANYFPWKLLEEKGVQVQWLSIYDSPNKIDAACRGARLLAVSFVQYLSGYRADLEALGTICQHRKCLLFVDAIQGLGAFPLDVRTARIGALAADGHKWLLGPEGCGILYVRRDLQDSIRPSEIGWTNFAGYHDYASRDATLRPDAGRYECGTLNTAGCYGLRASLELLLAIGIDTISANVLALTTQIARGVSAKGYELLGKRTRLTASGIVSFRRSDVDARAVVKHLRENKIIAAARQGWIRVSPHFYLGPEDAQRLIEALP